MMKKIRLSELLSSNHFINEEEQATLKQMMNLFIEKHCKAGSQVEKDLKDLTKLLINPWVEVHLEQLTPAAYHICLTENELEYEEGVETKHIQFLKKNLLDYHIVIKEEIPNRERWNLFAELIQEARKNKTYKEDIQAVRFSRKSKKEDNLNASEVFKIERGRHTFYGIIESLGEVDGKRRYNLHFLDTRGNQPVIVYFSKNLPTYVIEKPDSFIAIETKTGECPQDIVTRLI